jgi:flagellar protein FlaG
MSSDTFTTAMFLIAAIAAAGILLNAVFPVIYTMASSFTQSSHEADTRIREDYKIINTFARGGTGQIWMKNIGSNSIAYTEINQSDIFIGAPDNFESVPFSNGVQGSYGWNYVVVGDNNAYWDPGETVHITVESENIPTTRGDIVYFQFVTVNGIVRSTEFTASG